MWNSLNNAGKQVQIKEKFFDKYTLYQHSIITMGSLVIDTKNECRWDVKVLSIDEKYYNIEILTLDNIITETNNENVREISLLNNTFKKMYNELNLVVSHQGDLVKILNLDTVKNKWQKVKAEMTAIQANHQSIDGLIALNDATFASNENITEAVKSNEFFEVFFHCFFGTPIPGNVPKQKKSLFMQADVDWGYEIESAPSLPATTNTTEIIIKGRLYQILNNEWLNKAYGNFPITTANQLKPVLNETADYIIESKSGKVLYGLLQKEEVAHPQLLNAKITYKLVADGYARANQRATEAEPQRTNQPVNNPSRSILFD